MKGCYLKFYVQERRRLHGVLAYEWILEQAKQAEAKYMKTDGRLRALEGLPVAIKDEAYIKGERMTNGSLLWKDHVSDETNPTIDRVLKAGAIMHARVERVVFGAKDPKTGVCGSVVDLFATALNHHATVTGGILAEECGARLSAFFSERRRAAG